MKIAVIGAGWAGLAAAVRARQAGHGVALFEAAGMPGGRARSDDGDGEPIDNGQHILLGGYTRTLALMRDVGVDVERALLRRPLSITYADGSGFALRPSAGRLTAAARALISARGFGLRDKLSAVWMTVGWRMRGFRCAERLSVDELLRHAPTRRVREKLIEPLCVGALNTPIAEASGAVFLAVMRDSLFGARDASDLLLPQRPLAQLLPLPAVAWLRANGATVHLRSRVWALRSAGDGWALRTGARMPVDAVDAVDAVNWNRAGVPGRGDGATPGGEGTLFDGVILATPAAEAARLTASIAPDWSTAAAALEHEPIVTLVLRLPARRWPAPMLALDSDDARRPAQFAFKLGPQEDASDRVTLVISAAGAWLARGADAVKAAAIAQVRAVFAIRSDEPVDCVSLRADRRATFRCTPGLVRPAMAIAPGLLAAADYVDGPYPATLEAAVRAGEASAAAFH
ncbi:MAG: FAD-dependent oxidoreductase [Burkholderiaceae bacterium]